MSEKAKNWLTTAVISTLIGVGVTLVSATLYISETKATAAAAMMRANGTEVRLRRVEETIPRIDEKLGNIEELLKDHMREPKGAKP